MADVLDLDAVLAARNGGQGTPSTPVTAKLFGQDWELYASLPVATYRRTMAWEREGVTDLAIRHLAELVFDMVPAPVLDEWTARGLTIDDLWEIVPPILQAYQERGTEGTQDVWSAIQPPAG